MLEPAYQADVVIVGAGVAGLSAAHRLTSQGVTVAVLEAAPCVGGRMSTEKVDGFRLDRIGQLLSTAYPELRLAPGLDGLVLRPFAPGVLLHGDGRHHRVDAPAGARSARGALHAVRALASAPRGMPGPRLVAASRRAVSRRATFRVLPGAGQGTASRAARAAAPLGGAVDQARLGAALTRFANVPVERLLARPELPAGQSLAARGLPARTIEGFLRPLLAALLCDPALTTSSRCADLALRAFAGGRLCARGRRGSPSGAARADAADGNRAHGGAGHVRLDDVGDHGRARRDPVPGGAAGDGRAGRGRAAAGLRVPGFHPVTVVHHTTDEPPRTGSALLLDADRGGPVAHTAVISEVDPSRAPPAGP